MTAAFVEILGNYYPRTKPAKIEVDRERVSYWIAKGARPSDTVRTLIARHLPRGLRAPAGRRSARVAGPACAAVGRDRSRRARRCDSARRRCVRSPRRASRRHVVELTVAAGDVGKVIGRQGRTAEALRTLVAATAHHHGIRAALEIRDPDR